MMVRYMKVHLLKVGKPRPCCVSYQGEAKTTNTLDLGSSGVRSDVTDGTLNTDVLSVDETTTCLLVQSQQAAH